jgi:hypothetical protein
MNDQGHGPKMSVPDMPKAALMQDNSIYPARGHISHKLIDASPSPSDRAIGYRVVKRDDNQFSPVPEQPVQAHCLGEMVTSKQRVPEIQPAGYAARSIASWRDLIERDARCRRSYIRNKSLRRAMHAGSSPAEGP